MRNASYWVKLFARWAVVTLSISMLLFVAAGTTRLLSLRSYLVTLSSFLLATMLSVDCGLAKERSRTSDKGATPGRFASGFSFLATLTVAASEAGRLHWLHSVPADTRRTSLLLFAGAMALQMWAMVVNPFFSPDIRLQPERGHRLITCGPYRLLRHPGYLAMLVAVPASALAIGSWLALLPAAAFCLVILKRVGAEDEFLQKNLAGYSEYMSRIRGRLFPRMGSLRRPCQDSVSSTFRVSRIRSEVAVRIHACLIRHRCHGPGRSGSYCSSFGLLSRGHGRLSTSPAPWRRGALLLPLRGPPGFRLPPKKIGYAEPHLFRLLQKMRSLAWGAGATCLGVPRERAGQKKEIQIMYQNRISLIGFVGNDVQLKSTKNGTPVAVLSVATKSSWKNAKGEYDSRTEWHRCTAWGKLAEFAGKLEKGAH